MLMARGRVAPKLDDLLADVAEVYELAHPTRTEERERVYRNLFGVIMGDGSVRFGCQICYDTLADRSGLIRHVRSRHGEEESKAAVDSGSVPRPIVPQQAGPAATVPTAPPGAAADPNAMSDAAPGLFGMDADRLVDALTQLVKSHDTWRDRALAAEDRLTSVARAMGI